MNLAQLRASLALWRSRYAYRLAREKFWQRAHNQKGIAKWEKLRLEAKERIHLRLRQIQELQHPHLIVMYDSIEVSQIPPNPEAVAGYTGGKWPNYNEMLKTFPKAKHISIAVASHEDAQCLDVEPGDASNQNAPEWWRRQRARKVNYPKLYTSASNVDALVATMKAAGISRLSYRIWSAHYGQGKHICSPKGCGYPQAEATQWDDKSHNRNLDESLCSPSFFD